VELTEGGDILREQSPVEIMEARRAHMQVTISTPLEKIDVNAWDELQIDKYDLDTELQAIPGQIGYWISVAARFRTTVSAIRRDFDDWYGPLYETEMASYKAEAGRTPNMNSVDYLVRMKHKADYNSKKEVLENAEANQNVVEGMVEALKAKMQALIQLAKRQNVEYEHADTNLREKTSERKAFSSSPPSATSNYRKPDSPAAVEESAKNLRGIIGGTKSESRKPY